MCFAAVNNLKFQEFIPLQCLEGTRRMKAHLGRQFRMLLLFILFCFRTALPTKAVVKMMVDMTALVAQELPKQLLMRFVPQQRMEGNYHLWSASC